MKSILISIKPEWVEKILNGEKTIEIRKTMPKCELPIKCYIYCTKHHKYKDSLYLADNGKYDVDYYVPSEEDFILNGKVVTEFILNRVEELENVVLPTIPTCVYLTKTKRFASAVEKISCLSQNEIYNYLGGKSGYAWYINNLKIYDTPKDLSSFIVGKVPLDCGYGNYNIYNKVLKRPPQSWCYVEEKNDNT